MQKEHFCLVDDEGYEVEFDGWKLGTVRFTPSDPDLKEHVATAYFSLSDDGGYDVPTVFVQRDDKTIDKYSDEHEFLMRYGSFGTFLLIWCAKDADTIPELVAWFPSYEHWPI